MAMRMSTSSIETSSSSSSSSSPRSFGRRAVQSQSQSQPQSQSPRSSTPSIYMRTRSAFAQRSQKSTDSNNNKPSKGASISRRNKQSDISHHSNAHNARSTHNSHNQLRNHPSSTSSGIQPRNDENIQTTGSALPHVASVKPCKTFLNSTNPEFSDSRVPLSVATMTSNSLASTTNSTATKSSSITSTLSTSASGLTLASRFSSTPHSTFDRSNTTSPSPESSSVFSRSRTASRIPVSSASKLNDSNSHAAMSLTRTVTPNTASPLTQSTPFREKKSAESATRGNSTNTSNTKDGLPSSLSAGSYTSVGSVNSANSSQNSNMTIASSTSSDDNDILMDEADSNKNPPSLFTPVPVSATSQSRPFSLSFTSISDSSKNPVKASKSFTHSTPFVFNNSNAHYPFSSNPSHSFSSSSSSAAASGSTRILRRSKRLMNLESASTPSQSMSFLSLDSKKSHGKTGSSSSISSAHSSTFSHSSASSRSSMNSDISSFSASIMENPVSAFSSPHNSHHPASSANLLPKKRNRSSGITPDSFLTHQQHTLHSSNLSPNSASKPTTPFFKKPFFSTESHPNQHNPNLQTSSTQFSHPASSSTPLHNSVAPVSHHNSLYPSNNSASSDILYFGSPSSSPQDGGPFKVRKTGTRNSVHSDALKPFASNPTPVLRPLPLLPQRQQQQQSQQQQNNSNSSNTRRQHRHQNSRSNPSHLFAFSSNSPSPTPNNSEKNRVRDRVRRKLPTSPPSSLKTTSSVNTSSTTVQALPHSSTLVDLSISSKNDGNTSDNSTNSSTGSNTPSVLSPKKGSDLHTANSSSTPQTSSKPARPPFKVNASLEAETQYENSSPSKSSNIPNLANNNFTSTSSDSFKFAKPLQTAFMSTGLLSKRNRRLSNMEEEKLARPPDTPCKKPGSSHIDRININQSTSRGSANSIRIFGSSLPTPGRRSSTPLSSNSKGLVFGNNGASLFKTARRNTNNSVGNPVFNNVSGGFGNQQIHQNQNAAGTAQRANSNGPLKSKVAAGTDDNNNSTGIENMANHPSTFRFGQHGLPTTSFANSGISTPNHNLDSNTSSNMFNDSFDVTMDGTSMMMSVPTFSSSAGFNNLNRSNSSTSSTATAVGDNTVVQRFSLSGAGLHRTNSNSSANSSFVLKGTSPLVSKGSGSGNGQQCSVSNNSGNDSSFSTDLADNDMDISMDLDSTPLSTYSKKKAIENNLGTSTGSTGSSGSNGNQGNNSQNTNDAGFDFLERPKSGFNFSNDDLPLTPTKHGAVTNANAGGLKSRWSNTPDSKNPNSNSTGLSVFGNSRTPSFGFGSFNGNSSTSSATTTTLANGNSMQSHSPFKSSSANNDIQATKQTSTTSTITPGKYSAAARSTTPVGNSNNGPTRAHRMSSTATMTPLSRYGAYQNSNTGANASNAFGDSNSNNNNGSNVGNASFESDHTFSPHTPDVIMKSDDNSNYEPLFGSSLNVFNGGGINQRSTNGFFNSYKSNSISSTNEDVGNTTLSYNNNGDDGSGDRGMSNNYNYNHNHNNGSPRTPAKSTDMLGNPGSGDHLMIGGWASDHNNTFNAHERFGSGGSGSLPTGSYNGSYGGGSNSSTGSVFNGYFGNNNNGNSGNGSPGFGFKFPGGNQSTTLQRPYSSMDMKMEHETSGGTGNETGNISANDPSSGGNLSSSSSSNNTTMNRTNSSDVSFATADTSILGGSSSATKSGMAVAMSRSSGLSFSPNKMKHSNGSNSSLLNSSNTFGNAQHGTQIVQSGSSSTTAATTSTTDAGTGKDLNEDAMLSAKFGQVKLAGRGQFSYVYLVTEKSAGSPSALANSYAVKRTKHPYLSARERSRLREEVDALRALTIDYKKNRNRSGSSSDNGSGTLTKASKDNAGANTTTTDSRENALDAATEDEEGRDHIVTLVSDWEQQGFLYIMTEYCENGNLDDFLAKSGNISRLDEWRVWKILVEISMGLRYIHENGYLHLDIKPANIFITFEGSLKIGDFGMATKYPTPKGIEREGDREYIAPEVLTKQMYGTPADVFSLGIMMLEVAANIVLPDYGIHWQKLRSGDLSDAGRLSSGNLYYSDDEELDADDDDANDGAVISSSDDPGDEDEELDNDVTYGMPTAFGAGNNRLMASSETSGLVSPKFPPCSLALPSGLAPSAGKGKGDGAVTNFNSNKKYPPFNPFAAKSSSSASSASSFSAPFALPHSLSQPNNFSTPTSLPAFAPKQALRFQVPSTQSEPHAQFQLIQQQLKQQERAKRARRRANRRLKEATSGSGNGTDSHSNAYNFLQKQQHPQQRSGIPIASQQSPLKQVSFSSIQNEPDLSGISSTASAPRASASTTSSSSSLPSSNRKAGNSTGLKSQPQQSNSNSTKSSKHRVGRGHNKPPSWAPRFMVDDSGALDAIVRWMLSPDPESRPSAATLLTTSQVRWVEEHRKAGAVIYEGDYGPRPEDYSDGMEEDVDFNWR